MLDTMEKYRVEGSQRGDTVKAAKIIFESVAGDPASRLMGQVTRLPLGSSAIKTLGWKIKMLKVDYAKTERLAKAADRDVSTSWRIGSALRSFSIRSRL